MAFFFPHRPTTAAIASFSQHLIFVVPRRPKATKRRRAFSFCNADMRTWPHGPRESGANACSTLFSDPSSIRAQLAAPCLQSIAQVLAGPRTPDLPYNLCEGITTKNWGKTNTGKHLW